MIPKKEVGKTGIEASVLVQGSVPFHRGDVSAAFRQLDEFWELGGNAIDLAWLYRSGECTEIVGEWLAQSGVQDEAVLYTKGCHPLDTPRLTPELIRGDLEDELKRLVRDSVEFYGFHRDDPEQPVEMVLETLGTLREEGKVQQWAASNWLLPRIQEFNAAAERMGLPGFAFNNPNMSLGVVNEPMWAGCHTLPADEFAWHLEQGYPLWSWSSTGGGWFAFVENDDMTRVWDNETNRSRRAKARELGQKYGLEAVQVALAWVLSRPFDTWAIVGCDTPEQIRSSAAIFETKIPQSELDALTD